MRFLGNNTQDIQQDELKVVTASVLQLFAKMKDEFGMLFTHKEHRFTAIRAKDWAVDLINAGITVDEFNVGAYKTLKESEYPVERAYTFIKLCRDIKIDGVPDVREAYVKASNNQYPHEVVYETARRVGFWELRTQPEVVSYKSWQKHYSEVCSEYVRGARFTLPKERGIGYEHKPVTPDNPFTKEIDNFFAKYRRKKVDNNISNV